MEIIELDKDNLGNTLRLLRSRFKKDQVGNNESDGLPWIAYEHSLNKGSAAAKEWEKKGVKLKTLQYFVAVENEVVIGASGVYETSKHYFDSEWQRKYPELAAKLIVPGNFFMGWTAVEKTGEAKRKGLGLKLLKHGIIRAKKIADSREIVDPNWCVLADADSREFFEKAGLNRISDYLTEELFRDPISDLLARL